MGPLPSKGQINCAGGGYYCRGNTKAELSLPFGIFGLQLFLRFITQMRGARVHAVFGLRGVQSAEHNYK